MKKVSPDHGHHRPGRRLPRRVAAREGVRGARHQAPYLLCSIPTVSITSIRTRMSPIAASFLHYGDMTDSSSLVRVIQMMQPERDLQPGGAEPRTRYRSKSRSTPGQLGCGWARCGCSRRSASCVWRQDRFYQASTSETVRRSCRNAAERDHAFLSTLALRCGEALRLLDDGQLPRGLRLLRCNGILFNHESPDSRGNLRHAQDHPRAGPHQARVAGSTVPR